MSIDYEENYKYADGYGCSNRLLCGCELCELIQACLEKQAFIQQLQAENEKYKKAMQEVVDLTGEDGCKGILEQALKGDE